ncbi:hypothetical protein T265_10900 [Opisthorchis viverrini]|uniref:Uncharacterized protein n=1 Tax=Opisthorchis viverrini TaxID=6198 RepID=A0A074Z0U0_OPIVI|nr:hypothetical protein T265_10900 [Opisthorchis viverrini]KER20578.1 hypothetical protein T265_10900 [Opisthorchis viverrini]
MDSDKPTTNTSTHLQYSREDAYEREEGQELIKNFLFIKKTIENKIPTHQNNDELDTFEHHTEVRRRWWDGSNILCERHPTSPSYDD